MSVLTAGPLSRRSLRGPAVQAGGNPHLSNSDIFGHAGRGLVFDVNDFDGTLPGPRERNAKRLAASRAVAGGDNKFAGPDGSPNPSGKTPAPPPRTGELPGHAPVTRPPDVRQP